MDLALMGPIGLTKARILMEIDLSFLIIPTIRTIITINHSSHKRKFSSVSFPENVSSSRLLAVEKTQTRYLRTIRIASQTLATVVILSGRLITSGISSISSDRSPVLISTLLRKIKKISFLSNY